MKKLMAIGVMLVLMAFPSMLIAQEYMGGLVTPDGVPCEVYCTETGRYAMVFPYTGQALEILVTLHGPRVVMMIAEEAVFSSDPPYERWTWHMDTKDKVLGDGTFGHIVCSMVAEHFLKAKQVV